MAYESLVSELYKELGRMQFYINKLESQVQKQSQTIQDQAEIIMELRGGLQ